MTTDASTAYRDTTASQVEALTSENARLRAENTSLRLARTKARGEAVGFAISSAWALGVIALCILGIGATAKTCAYGADARRNAEREAAEYHRRTSGTPPFAVMCSSVNDGNGNFDHGCLVYRVAADPRPLGLRCDSDPQRWNNGCREPGRVP